MNKTQKAKLAEEIKSIINEQDMQGYNVLSNKQINTTHLLMNELTKLEKHSSKYSEELREISKFVRCKLWKKGNEIMLYATLHRLNQVYSLFDNILGNNIFWTLNTVIEYAIHLTRYQKNIVTESEISDLIDNIQLVSAKKIIPKQWEDILKSDDTSKAFLDVFDDIFTNAIEKYPERLLVKLDENNILCRMVKEKECVESRFIPRKECTVNNRWNPPGKSFLYLSYGDSSHPFDEDISLEERVCVLECRTEPNTDCCFCNFRPTTPGNIIDLSFNDSKLAVYRRLLDEYTRKNATDIVDKLLVRSDIRYNANDERYIKNEIQKQIHKLSDLEATVSESIAKQYMKMICSCIYSRVDGTEEEKEKAYKSFHILAKYLMDKGITGIIYPCTRDKNIKGKNLVLFEPNDAEQIIGTIKQYHYKEG